ncbi:hypothetical protein [Aneurinibacillus migulanus]|uniref:Uncharacterized protein n=1 Tax=Aneurinibacillus migulanus TaxID=47500 RepID=A0A1G8WHA3_ANEMI|nr:hypothetical protein [Aneurinibacillus migulanus]MED0894915.1 hypothetical protein [Aneurinibacillus migulanus]MED1614442.1 hypothetical protein [Aneurinibacillus migulanus]GED14856.1 hypothetical protein AMI01nite_28470 [Aneurinibacillus migulanus]SDJ77581.1 hypothetical protein SAMN04487909_12846 [Aneurinibacillus migulanus]
MDYLTSVMNGIKNILWHIETNREYASLEEVERSLKNMLNDYEQIRK